MAIGDMLGKAVGALGGAGVDDIVEKIRESGVDLSALADLDADAVTTMLEENGIDLSALETLGLSVDDILTKIKGML